MASNVASLRDRYDIVVVGAGPAGLCAVLRILSTGLEPSILLVDKQVPWEKPIACAEAAGRLGIHEAVTMDPGWIRFVVSNAAFHAPGGTSVTYTDKNKGYILDRARMQHDLADTCSALGATTLWDTRVTHVGMPEKGRRAVGLSNGRTVSAGVVIDASGPLSTIGKGEKIAWKCQDLEPAYFALVKGLDLPSDAVHIYVGKNIAPGGYAWVFPRGEGTANVGVLIGRQFCGKVNLRELLDGFMQRTTPTAKTIVRFAGPIPCAYARHAIAVQGLLKAGDAASTANPISRAGIAEAMLSGKLAGQYALDMLGAETAHHVARICRDYEKSWYERRGKRHCKLAKVKSSLAKVPDRDYDRAAESLSRIPQTDLLMSKVFALSMGRFPRLVWAMRHLL